MNNVFQLTKAAHESGVATVKCLCIDFIADHYNEFLSQKEGGKALGLELFQEVCSSVASHQPSPEMDSRPPRATIRDDLKLLYATGNDADAEAVLPVSNNEKVKVHRALLANVSQKLAQLVSSGDVFEVPNLSVSAFRSLQRFIYYGETRILTTAACELLYFGTIYDIPGLVRICENKILHHVDKQTAIPVLEVSFTEGIHEKGQTLAIRQKALRYSAEHLAEVDLLPLTHPTPRNFRIVMELLLTLQQAAA